MLTLLSMSQIKETASNQSRLTISHFMRSSLKGDFSWRKYLSKKINFEGLLVVDQKNLHHDCALLDVSKNLGKNQDR